MTYLNITIETDNADDEGYVIEENYFIAFPFSDDVMTLWYSIEDKLPAEFVDSVIDYEVSNIVGGNQICVSGLDEILQERKEEEEYEEKV